MFEHATESLNYWPEHQDILNELTTFWNLSSKRPRKLFGLSYIEE
jgi:hypothetical protein